MSRYTLEEFVDKTVQRDRGQGLFELESERILEINLNGKVWTKMGSMISYRGDIKFKREGMLEQGLGNLLKKAVSGEGAQLTAAEGQGQLYLADAGKKIIILNLQNQSITVNGNDVLAFETAIQNDIKMMKRVAGMMAGGLFNVQLQGTGLIAMTSHYEPMTLLVKPGTPVYTDPNATIAWSSNLEPTFKSDVNIRTLVGRSSGETFQMAFEGDGFVVVQPYEEIYATAAG